MARRATSLHADDPVSVGRRLRETRRALGISQRSLSFEGCTPAYISRIEKGERMPSLQLLRALAERLGVTEEFLAYGRGEAKAPPPPIVEARVALELGDVAVARRVADELLSRARSEAERALAFAVLGEAALIEGDAAGARSALEHARVLDPGLEVRDYDFCEALGRMFARLYEYESAAAVFGEARARASADADARNEVRFGNLLANSYVDSGNFGAAEEVLAAAIGQAREVTDALTVAKMYWSQSRLHALQHDSTNAARYAQRALELLEHSKYRYHAALAHQLLAHVELDRGNAERAVELLERAAPIIEESGRRYEQTNFKIEQARALLVLGRREDAAGLALEAASWMHDLSPIDAGRSYALVADVFLELEDDERAVELYELAAEHLAATPNRYLVEVYGRLAEIYERQGDEEKMVAALKRGLSVQRDADRSLSEPA